MSLLLKKCPLGVFLGFFLLGVGAFKAHAGFLPSSLKAEFTQSYKSVIDQKMRVSQGDLVICFQGIFALRFLTPRKRYPFLLETRKLHGFIPRLFLWRRRAKWCCKMPKIFS